MSKVAIALLLCILSMDSFAQAKDPSSDCLMRLKDDDRFTLLFAKMPMDISKGQPIEVMADSSKVSIKEKSQLSVFVKEGQACYESGTDWRQKNYPAEANSLMISYTVDVLSAMADLYAGKMTYGEVAKYRAKRMAEFQVSINSVVQQIKSKQATDAAQAKLVQDEVRLQKERLQHESDMAEVQQRQERELAYQQQEESRRSAALQFFFAQRLQTQAQPIYQIQQPPRSLVTNCSTSGGMTSCTTR